MADSPSLVTTDLASDVMFNDPFPRYAHLRHTAPVSKVQSKQLVGSGGYMLTRYDDVLTLLNDARFSSDSMGQGDSWIMNHLPKMLRLLADSMVYKDDPDHARLRRLVNKAFTPRMVQGMADDMQHIIDQLIARVDQGVVVDLVSEIAVPLPLTVISNMLGVTDDDRDQFHVLMTRFVASVGSGSLAAFARAIPSARKLLRMIERMADERRAVPDDGLISALVAASDDGDKLSPDEVSAMIFLLMLAGHDTTANLIGSSMLALMENRDQAARFRDDATLTPSAVEELLRFTTPVPCGTPELHLKTSNSTAQ